MIQTPVQSSMWFLDLIPFIIFEVGGALFDDESSSTAKTVAFAVLTITLLAAVWFVVKMVAFFNEGGFLQ